MRKKNIEWILIFVFLLFMPSSVKGRPLSVVTTTTTLAAITREIGGDRVRVKSIAKGSQDPHYVAAKPSYMRLLNRADLLLYNGLQLEIGWLPLLVQGARNPGLVALNPSQGITVLDVPKGEITRAQGDIHPEGNPHYWLDPRNGLSVARRIAGQLKALASGDAAYFEERLGLFEKNLKGQIQRWEKQMMPYGGKAVVAYHMQWEYLAKWLGISIIGYVENKPGIPPAPRHVAGLIRKMREEKIKALMVASFINPTIAQSVAEKGEAKMIILPASVGGEKGIESYGSLFESIINKMVNNLR
jgi:zinc/manganese transport system substrate-binding protein